jgi:adenosylhomocysteine nucleosidase
MAQGPAGTDVTCVVGIVCALNIEIAPFLDRAKRVRKVQGNDCTYYGMTLGERKLVIAETGAGANPARRGAQALIDAHDPPWILSTGLSGGLVEQLHVGDILLADSVSLEGQPDAIRLTAPEDNQPGVHTGKLLTVPRIVRLVSEKKQLQEQSGAWGVDMESYHVAQVCVDRGKPFVAVRVISDDLTADLPPEIMGILGPKGTVRAGAVFASLLNRPSCVTDLWALRNRTLSAAERLAQYLVKMLG